jgi:DNA repair protein RecN (Recombination protein N)
VLEEIRITNLGVIEAATIEIGPGLTVITGETGAGKTMLVTALGLLLGARSDSGAVRAGARSARVEGVIRTDSVAGLADLVDEAGGDVEDDRVLVARNVSAEGRSRAFVGGASVPVATLAGIAEPLVAVHGQSDQHRLLHAGAQREALDRYSGPTVATLLEQYRGLYRRLSETDRTLEELTRSARERLREAEVLRLGLSEIESVAPQPGEDLDLAAEEARLGHADAIRRAAETARELLSAQDGGHDALATLAAARAALESVRDHDAAVGALADRVAELTYLLSDAAADVASYATAIETDPVRLAVVSERRAALTTLTRKYGATAQEVLDWAESSARRLTDLDGTDERIEVLRAESNEIRGQLAEVGARLTLERTEAARRLAADVTAELSSLAMPNARLQISVTQAEVEAPVADPSPAQTNPGAVLCLGDRWVRMSSSGLDEVEIRLAANAGASPRPLAKGASGGELSRVMLALEVVLAGTSPVPTFVFDEVDAGVGGAAAVEIGRRLARLAATAQVLVVTHLPQVAAYADQHIVVAKSDDGSVTTSGVQTLDDAARERELSRMLAGLSDSETALAHARELLEVATPARALGSAG